MLSRLLHQIGPAVVIDGQRVLDVAFEFTPCGVEAIQLDECSKGQDGFSAVHAPALAGAHHANADQGPACTLGYAASDGRPPVPVPFVVHALPVDAEVVEFVFEFPRSAFRSCRSRSAGTGSASRLPRARPLRRRRYSVYHFLRALLSWGKIS